jgi:Fur family ferric uptake transcriptional regulator
VSERHAHEPVAADSLRAGGRRLTRQRAVIWDALLSEGDRHQSAEEIAERAQSRMPGLSPSTVYRTLEVLVGQGLVLRTDLGGDRAYYEPAHEHRHHHVVCERCGAVTHLHDEVLDGLPARIEEASGYRLGDAEITFFGLCATCAPAP